MALRTKLTHQDPKEAKEVKPVLNRKVPKAVPRGMLTETGILLSGDEIAILKHLNLPKGRSHRREINALLKKQGITWTCPYSIIRGNGMNGKGDTLYAVYRDAIHDKSVVIGSGTTSKVKELQNLETGAWCVLKVISNYDEVASKEHKILQQLGKADSLLIQKDSKKGIHKREIIMERANGVELFKLIQSGQLTTDSTLLKKIALNILKQLKDFHDKGILLRDLKLENIVVDPETGEATIIDVGFAIAAKNGVGSDGARCGTIQYIPPEILCDGKNTNYTIASDTYAAGIVLQAILTGEVYLHTQQNGFYFVNDGIQRTTKYGSLEVPYIVEKEIRDLYTSMFATDPKLRPRLAYACYILERHIPKDQPVKVSQQTGSVSLSGMFKKPLSEKVSQQADDVFNLSVEEIDSELRHLDIESFAGSLKEHGQAQKQTISTKQPATVDQPRGLASQQGIYSKPPLDKEMEADMRLLDSESFGAFLKQQGFVK